MNDISGAIDGTKRTGGKPGPTPSVPDPVDVHVGDRLRLRRRILKMSQGKLGALLGVTFQQVQKYERGTNRIGASRLFDLARLLEVPVGYFYADMPAAVADRTPRPGCGLSDGKSDPWRGIDPMERRETLELVREYYRIKDGKKRTQIMELCRSMAGSRPPP